MERKESPLKSKPLRYPGQSVQERIDELIDEKGMSYMIGSVVFILVAALEWHRFFQNHPPKPIHMTIIAIGVTLYSIYKIIKVRKEIDHLKQGRDGEKAVGQYLELLREDGCIVFHDIIGDKFNIDHVVISEKGIYCIETKTYSKPKQAEPTVRFKEGDLDIDGIGRKNEIIRQVQAATAWLKETLKESTGKDLPIKPVVLFPGWWIETSDFNEIWVLNPKAFPKFLSKQSNQLPTDIKKMVGLHLGRYIRAL